MSPFRFKAFQPVFFKTAAFILVVLSAFVFAGNSHSADVTLAWDGVSQSGVAVMGYRVYYGTQSGDYSTCGCQVSKTSCTVVGLAEGETYHFVARAYNTYGESANSDPVSYTVPEALQTFTITASAGSGGSISSAGISSVTEKQNKAFTITPNAGFHIDNVLVDGVNIGSTSSYTFNNISASHTIYATFASNPVTLLTIAASDDGNGNISPKGNVTVIEGNNQNFSITPKTGYHIADVVVDGASVGARSGYEFPNVTTGHTISASFAANMFTITATAGSNGRITPGTVSVAQGSGKTFAIAADNGYEIADVTVDDQSRGPIATYTFTDVSNAHKITASFKPVDVSAPPDATPPASDPGSSDSSGSTGGTGAPSAAVIVDNGDSGTSATGTWAASAGTGPYGADSLYNKTVSGTYSFEAALTGSHEVYLWWTYHYNRHEAVPVAIYDGTRLLDTVIVNQLQNGSRWNILGTFTFSGTAKVVVASTSVDNSTCADAVKFLSTGSAGSTGPSDPSTDNPADSGSSSGATDNSGSTGSAAGDNPSGSSDSSSSTGTATDTNGVVSPAVTPKQEFINQAPAAPGLLLPIDGALDVSLTPLLEIAGFADPDADDDHSATRWQVAMDDSFEQLVLDVISRPGNYLVNFLVPDGALCADQNYYWRAKVKDAHDWSDWSEPFAFATAGGREDANGNGVPDIQEPGYSDLDNNGQNDNDQPLMRVFKSEKGQTHLGINAVEGVSRINCFTGVDPASIPVERRFKLKYGLMVFNVTVDHPGATARFELYLPEKPHAAAKWYKYDSINGWYEYPVDIVGDKYMVEITDGQKGDADGVENGIIVDPIGLAELSNGMESVDGLDAAGPGDVESTIDNAKSACFIQATLDHCATETSAVGMGSMSPSRWMISVLLILGLAIAWFQAGTGRSRNRRH